MGEEMRAVTFNRYGPPEVLELGRRPIPAIGPDEVLVRVKAASINPADCKLLLAGWLETGKVKPVIDRVFPREQAAEAHQASESGRTRGKLVLEVR